ncbi:MAG: apolipoprotein N-acyltransferase [Rhodothermaeota bacterium MED-G64]|mgnify:FL=1|nr:MAG: apolipoprotein N-acyltransferase [Rhodothermaeota bacterium MED-G64]
MTSHRVTYPLQAFIHEWWSASPWWIAVRAGVFLAISFPPVDLPFMLLLGWLDLQVLLFSSDHRIAQKRRLLIFSAILLWNLLTTYWLMMATLGGGLAAIVANAGLMTLALFVARAVVKVAERSTSEQGWQRVRCWIRPVIWIPLWLGFEFGHHQWDLAWPWLTLANAWSTRPWAIQWVEYTGYVGASAWFLIVAAWGYEVWVRPVLDAQYHGKEYNRVHGAWGWTSRILPGLALVGVPLGLSLWIDMNRSVEWEALAMGPTQDVLIIQLNRDSYEPFGGYASVGELIDSTAAFTSQAIMEGHGDSVDLAESEGISDSLSPTDPVILWPENTLDGALTLNSYEAYRMRSYATQWQAHVLTGVGWIEYDEALEGQRHPALLRRAPSNRTYDVYNAAWHIRPNREDSISTYKKANLVPAVERFPFADELVRLPFVDRLPWTSFLGFGRGNQATVFELMESQKVAPVICYDSVFSDWMREYVAGGAQWIAVLTNDGWWGRTSGHTQHYDFARLRAIETRRPIVRAANSGTSGWIDPLGDRQLMSDYGVVSSHWVKIPTQTMDNTFFVERGNLLGLFVSVLSGLWLTVGFFIHILSAHRRRQV